MQFSLSMPSAPCGPRETTTRRALPLCTNSWAATGEHLVALLADENVPVSTVDAKDWTRQNLHVHVESSGEQYRFVMPGATLDDDEFRQLEEQVLEIESGAILVISGSLPPGVKVEKLTQLISAAQKQGIRCIIDSSGDALTAALALGDIELVKPNLKELSALVNRDLTQPDDVRKAPPAGKIAVAVPPRCAMARATLIPPPPGSNTGAEHRSLPSG